MERGNKTIGLEPKVYDDNNHIDDDDDFHN